MIRLTQVECPLELTAKVKSDKTKAFIDSGKKEQVWKEPYIHSALLGMSHNKCCYCECSVNEEGRYMEIEHFHDKNSYPNEVVEWSNLLPSCKTCNVHKGEHDTVAEPIVNPIKDDPKEHLLLVNNIRYRGRDIIGKTTIDVLDLNNLTLRLQPRSRIVEELLTKLEQLSDRSVELVEDPHAPKNKITKFKNAVRELFQVCTSNQIYTACKCTAMLGDDLFSLMINNMKSLGIWEEQFQTAYEEMINHKL